MLNFVEITSNDTWFKQHPEKIAGEEYETTSFYFPIMVRGTKEDVLRVTGMSEDDSTSNHNKKYDWDINFSSGPSKGKNLSELEFQSVEVYDDNIIAVEFWDGGIAQLNVSEVIGLLSITKNVVKIAVILDGKNVKSDQKIKRRLQSIANKSNRLIAVSNLGNRENRSYPFMFIHKDDLKNYTLSTEFQEKLITPRKALFEKIVADVNLDKEKRIRLAKAKAKALKVKLSLGQLGMSVVMNAEDIKLTTPFNKQIIKAMKKGYQPTDIFHLGKPFGELEKHIPDYKIVMTGKVLSKAMTKDKDHQLNWANFIDLPFFLNNPTAIFKSETIGYVVLTEVFDVNNKPVMISLHINKKMVITNIASLYVRNYNTYKRWIEEKLHLYINEKSDLFNYHRLQLP